MQGTSSGLSNVPGLELAPEEIEEANAAARVSHASSGDKIKFAPRCVRSNLVRIREEFQLSPLQLAQMLSGSADHWTQANINRWEAGLERVPSAVAAKVEKLHAQLLRKAAAQPKEEEPPMVMVAPEYPHQDTMLGPDYQATVPKMGGGGKEKKDGRKDVCIWSMRTCNKEGVELDAYLEQVRRAMA